MSNLFTDSIAAIATPLSDSGIGIIRVSGNEAIEIVKKCFFSRSKKNILDQARSHTIHYGFIWDQDKIVDEVMVSVMLAPKTYTKENTVEINCHGGVLVMQKVLEVILSCGARLAEPGEFTKRAFLNGRIDLSEAEAVMDVIHSQNEYALQASMGQLQGTLAECIKSLRAQIIYEIAFIESALDDPEHISLEGYTEKLGEKLYTLKERIKELIESADNGRLMKEGISTVIVGKPNAGKSSFLNAVLGEDRAIVTDIAGTTRDILQENIQLHGIGLNIVDTAGIRDTEDIVEKIGVNKAKDFAQKADLLLYVVDSSVPLDENDKAILSILQNRKAIILFNKSDLQQVVTEDDLYAFSEGRLSKDIPVIHTSAKDLMGIKTFEETIQGMFFSGDIFQNHQIIITNMRHKEALINAYDALEMVQRSIDACMPEDFYSIDLMSAYASLGRIIGEEIGDDLIEQIFSKFCMGK